MTVYSDTLFLLVCILFHETGHYIFFRIFKVKPKIGFKWWGISMGSPEEIKSVRMKDLATIAMQGITFGMIPFFFYKTSYDMFLIYIICCLMDIYLVMKVLSLKKEYWNMPYREADIKYTMELWKVKLVENNI